MSILKQKIGIIGGGQLGKMMIQAGSKLDFYFIILDPTPDCPAHSLADEHIVASFDNEKSLRTLAESVDILTYEFEHIGVDTLIDLEKEGYIIYPTPTSLKIIQNKYTQKETLVKANIAVPNFEYVESEANIRHLGNQYGYPLLLKSCYGGYDGKGNRVITDQEDVDQAYLDLDGDNTLLMVEEFIDYRCEISVIAGRDKTGNIVTFPIGENLHRDNILYQTTVPANISDNEKQSAIDMAHQVLEVFNGIGIFCIEMFVTTDGNILINEIAPRPHNSGHYSIEACMTSQFDQHIRAITGLPLGDTSLLKPARMTNILGDRGPELAKYTGIEEAMALSGVNPHIYGKSEVRPGRKMGHITTIGDDLTTIEAKSDKANQLIKFR